MRVIARKIETFDAGRLDFFGTTVPITLYPPYQLPTPPDGPITHFRGVEHTRLDLQTGVESR